MIDYYGDKANYIHLKFGRMQKRYHFTDQFIEKYPNFCSEYRKYFFGKGEQFTTPLDIAQYVDMYNVPVKFYYNYTDTPSRSIEDVFEYILREFTFSNWEGGAWLGFDGEKAENKKYKVTRVEEK